MFRVVLRGLIQAIMLVAVIGQAMAYNTSISCETPVGSYNSFHDSSPNSDNKDLTLADSDTQDDCCDIECCDIECICIANACSSFAYFNAEIASIKRALITEADYIQHSAQPQSIASLLYRPPIFTS